MTVRWYICDVQHVHYSSDITGAEPRETYEPTVKARIWHNATVTDPDGTVHELPVITPKYRFPWSAAYLEDVAPFTVSLVRTEDKQLAPGTLYEGIIEPEDCVRELTTPEDWAWLAETYPSLVARFADQPTA